jgi:hypothetical protein
MSLTFLLAACAFAAVLGALVACIDRWRDSRLTIVQPVQRARGPVGRVSSSVPSARKRAA